MKSIRALILVCIFFTSAVLCFAAGIIDENVIREFTYYGDTYSFGASAQSGWEILSASANGGGSGNWVASPPATNADGSKNYPRGSVSAYGMRIPGASSANMFSAILSGSIRPTGPGEGSQTYTYSVRAQFKGELSLDPTTQTAPLWGSAPQSYRLLSTYDGDAHLIGGYWRTTPNRAGENSTTDYTRSWASYYGGETRWPGVLTVEGSAHSDGGDGKSAVLRVVGVSSITATTTDNRTQTSSTDGLQRNSYQEAVKDSNNNNIPEEIPTLFSKQAEPVTLSASPTPGTPWPMYSTEGNLSYPIWSISNVTNQYDYLTSIHGASSGVKAAKGFGNLQVNASCGNHKSLFLKFIRVKFAKKNIYAGWDMHEIHDVTQYLAGKSSIMGCANPSTCTNLQCNHRGVYDESHFSWSVNGDAELVLTQNNQTVYAKSFSPAEEKDKPTTTKKYFTGKIRFTKPSLVTENNITVTATSEELSNETDSFTIIPQYINLSVQGVAEVEYVLNNGSLQLNNPQNAESTVGAFIPVNDNDSNHDRNVDRNMETETAGTDPDLVEISIVKKINGTIDSDHPITLSLYHVNGGASGIKVWKDASRSELFIDGSGSKQFTSAASVPASVFIEAVGATSANLTISHSFAVNTDPADTNWYSSNICDSMRLNAFSVDLRVDGVQDENTVVDNTTGNPSRILVHEEFPGGEINIKPAGGEIIAKIDTEEQPKSLYLIPLTFSGSNLVRALQQNQGQTNEDNNRTITFTCNSDKVEFFERVKNANGIDVVDANNNPVYKKLSTIALKVSDLPKTVYMRPIKDSDSKRDVELKLSYTSPQNAASHEDTVKLTFLNLDVDVDSNNDGTVAVDDEAEDETELYAPIEINSGDKDNDGIADNIDFEISGTNNVFKEMKICLPKSIDLNNCKIKINYGAASLPDANGNFTSSGNQSLRLWKKQSNQLRTAADYIAPTCEDDPSTPETNEETYYTPTELLGAGERTGSLWVESVCQANGYNAQITVTIIPITTRTVSDSTVFPADEANIPETYNLSDTVGFSTLGINLTFPNPIPAVPAAGTTPVSRGYDTILISNIADESSNAQCPDYANFESRNDTSLLQMNMTVSIGNLSRENFKIKFEYEGVAQLNNLNRAQIDCSEIKDIFMRGNKKFWDYTPFKKGLIRVWASSKPVENAGVWSSAKVITATSARDYAKYGIGTGNYFAPTNSDEDAYLLSDLFPDSNNSNFAMTFWLEGINPSEKTPIKATLLYNDNNSWREIAASFVNVRVLEAKVILNTNNDKDYALDETDHKIKDQHDGFQGWFADPFPEGTRNGDKSGMDRVKSRGWNNVTPASNTWGMENLFPAKITLPKLPTSNMVYSIVSDADVFIEKPDNVIGLQYLTQDCTEAILRKISTTQESPFFNAITDPILLTQGANKELLFSAYRDSDEIRIKVSLYLFEETGNPLSKRILLDNSVVTFRPIDRYFWMGSCRTLESENSSYPNDPGKPPSEVNQYGNVTSCSGWSDIESSQMVNPCGQYFVYLHGFHSNETDAIASNRIVFRRLYWSGYRGNYIGITWQGNSIGFDLYNYFDCNMENALLSGRAVKNFLSSLGNNPMNRHIAAHSLGNLVMWEALRQHALCNQNTKLVNNAVSIQAAVWEEAFWPQTSLTYQKQEYTLGIPNTGTVTDFYSIDRLINNSWVFWFNQGDNGMYAAKKAVNMAINSYVSVDEYLNGTSPVSMKRNDFYSSKDYYNRSSGLHRNPNSLPDKAAMFKEGEVIRQGLSIPLSAFTDPVGTKAQTHFGNNNINAIEHGWRYNKHSDYQELPFYSIKGWYNVIFESMN